jgi:protein-tyrosine-phosphatase
MAERLRVLFLGTGNAPRSQVAEALLRYLSKQGEDVRSAGRVPHPTIHPSATSTLEQRYSIDTASLHAKPIREFLAQRFDSIIVSVPRRPKTCPVFPVDPERIH